MVPFLVLLVMFVVLAALRRVRRLSGRYSLADAAALSLAVMLLFTASAHFNAMRADLVLMVPPFVPRPELLITITGVLELAGAAGLMVRRTRSAAGVALAALFVLLLPANIYAARAGLTLGGRPVTALWLRVPQQLVYIAFALAPVWSRIRSRRRRVAAT